VDAALSPAHAALRAAVRALCARFPNAYWRELDRKREHPGAFVTALTEAGYLAALIPSRYGGGGLGVAEASIIWRRLTAPAATAPPATPRCT
jgi:acyl-CoA dehydrogenase